MKKKTFSHPRLYLNIFLKNGECLVNYLDNNLNSKGERIIQTAILSNLIPRKEHLDYLKTENKKEFIKLDNFIKTQKKVLEKYKKARNYDRVKIIENSMEILNEFKQDFKDCLKE